jgi:hypothetical protein
MVDAAEDALVGTTRIALNEGLHAVCAGAGLTSRLPATCGEDAPPAHTSLPGLRSAIIRDAIALPGRLAPQLLSLPGAVSIDVQRSIAAATLLEAMFESADPLTWGAPLRRLAEVLGTCDGKGAECQRLAGALDRVGRMLEAIVTAEQRLRTAASSGPDAFAGEVFEVVDAALDGALQQEPKGALTVDRARVAGLIRDLLSLRREVEAAHAQADSGARRRVYVGAAARGLETVARLWSTSTGGVDFPLPVETAAVLQRLAQSASDRDASVVLELLAPHFREVAMAMSLPEEVPAVLAFIADLSTASTGAEVRQRLRAALLPLPPWAESLVLDANANWPRLDSRDFRVNGDLTVGYNGDSFGVVFRGSGMTYDLSSDSGLTQTDRYEGGVEGWWTYRPGPRLGLELRGTGQAVVYDSTVVDLNEDLLLGDETSVMARGTLLAGLRANPTTRWGIGVWGGAGFQYEFHDGLTLQRDTTTLSEDEPTTIRAEGRVHLQFDAWPQVLSLRARSDFNLLRISHDAGRIVVGEGASEVSTEQTTLQQVEILSRFMVDIDAFRFFELRPSIHAGLNTIVLEDLVTHTPVVGAGIRREAF